MKFVVFSRRWEHEDTYEILRIESGWHIKHLAINGNCNKKGSPFLFKNLNQDSINYPEALGDYLEWLWNKSEGKNEEWIQEKLNEISNWINVIEKSSPNSDIWKDFTTIRNSQWIFKQKICE